MSKVVVFGSLNMDLSVECERVPAAGETVAGSGFISSPGGKGANQAYAARRMGATTHLIGAVGDDAFGRSLVKSLCAAEVACDNLHVRDTAPTGCAIIVRTGGDNRIVVDAGANLVLTAHEVCQAIDEVSEPGDIFVTQLECDFSATLDSLAYAREMGLYTILNPAPAPAPHTLTDIYGMVDLMCVNETECVALTGVSPVDAQGELTALGVLASFGIAAPVITLGRRGSVALVAEQLVRVPASEVTSVDSTGAGDTYLGALAAELAAGNDIDRSLEVASAAAALACTAPGAQRAMPSRVQVHAFMSSR